MMNQHTWQLPPLKKEVKILDPTDLPGLVYLLPTPKSPHGCDVDPIW